MSVATELGTQLPLAAEVAGIDMTTLIAVGSMAAAGVSIKKLTPALHETVPEGHMGVLFKSGQPVEKKVGEPWQIRGHEMPGILRRRQQRYFPRRGRFVTEDELDAGEGKHIILPPNFYFIGPFSSIELVNTADQPMTITAQFEVPNGDHIKQLEAHAQVTWGISPKGDAPLLAITQLNHEMKTKKDTDKEEKDRKVNNAQSKSDRVNAIAQPELVKAIEGLGKDADEICALDSGWRDKIADDMARSSQLFMSRYGFEIRFAKLVAITRVGEEVLGDSMGRSRRVPEPEDEIVTAVYQKPDDNGNGEVVPLHLPPAA